MKNFVSEGNVVDAIAAGPTGVKSGEPVMVGALFGVPATDAAAGETFALALTGCFRLPKAAGELSAGVVAYWQAATSDVSGTATANYKIGVVIEHAATGDADVLVRLDGVATAVTPAE